ncbi:DUF397 domain-containing protein [Streptomyces spiralis]|uniref:DUF397 domain-containing protein n=1 Tax=Streptomyces spiralis TaxID=66376 RepID=UPI0036B7A29D
MLHQRNWHTSSYTSQDSCVEVADDDPDIVMVRDTKDQGRGVMSVTPVGWAVFVEYVKQL